MRDCLAILGEEQVIRPAFARDLLPLVGLRNRLVHLYTEIDHDRIYVFLTHRLGDFERYAQHIVAYVETHTDAEESSDFPPEG